MLWLGSESWDESPSWYPVIIRCYNQVYYKDYPWWVYDGSLTDIMGWIVSHPNSSIDILTLKITVLEIGSLKRELRLNEVIKLESYRTSISIRRGEDIRGACSQKKVYVRTEWERSYLQGKERGLWRNQSCWQPDPALLASSLWDINFVCGILL